MTEISDFQRTNSEFAKSRQNHLKMHTNIPSVQSLSNSVHYHQRDIFRKKLIKFYPWSRFIAISHKAFSPIIAISPTNACHSA
jgi:hypothetical protein